MIRLALLQATVGQQRANLSADAINRHPQRLRFLRLFLQSDLQRCPAKLRQHLLAHALAAVFGDGVGVFVPHDHGETILILRDRQNPGVNDNLASGHTPCIHLRVFDEIKLPIVAVQMGA